MAADMDCPECKTVNTPIESFPHPGLYLNHHHYKCSNCGFKWGSNEELPKPLTPFDETPKGKIRVEVLIMKDEGLI